MSNNKKNSDLNNRENIYSYSDHHVNKRKNNSKKIRNKKIVTSILLVFSVFVGLIGGAFLYAHKMLDSINYRPIQEQSNTNVDTKDAEYIPGTAQDPMVLNVALFGVDQHAKADVNSRSDSIMILSLDSRRKKTKITSIMRDTYLNIPGHGSNRVNAAIAFGGPSLAIKTIEQNFGIKIDKFCTVDFAGFKDIIDIIGGLDIDITKDEAHHINRLLIELDAALKEGGLKPFKSELIAETSGMHHLNGAQSLQYSRSRKVAMGDGTRDDYARTKRQRKVLSLVAEKLKKASLPQILNIIEKAGPYVSTNLKKNEIITLGKNALKYLQYEICEFRLPEDGNFEGQNINGASVLVINNMNKARYDFAKFIYEDSIKIIPPENKSSTTNQYSKSNNNNSINTKSNKINMQNTRDKKISSPLQ